VGSGRVASIQYFAASISPKFAPSYGGREDLDPHLIHRSLTPPDAPIQIASGLSLPFSKIWSLPTERERENRHGTHAISDSVTTSPDYSLLNNTNSTEPNTLK